MKFEYDRNDLLAQGESTFVAVVLAFIVCAIMGVGLTTFCIVMLTLGAIHLLWNGVFMWIFAVIIFILYWIKEHPIFVGCSLLMLYCLLYGD